MGIWFLSIIILTVLISKSWLKSQKENVELNQRVDRLSGRMDTVEKELPLFQVDADRISNAVKAKGAETLG